MSQDPYQVGLSGVTHGLTRSPNLNPDLRTGLGGVDRRWTFVVDTRTSDRVDRVVSVKVVVVCDEPWISKQGGDDYGSG